MAELWPVELSFRLECEMLELALKHARLRKKAATSRRDTFWTQVTRYHHEEDLRMLAQQQIWQQQRAEREQACLMPLSTCAAELRRWQGVQRLAHERKCASLRQRRQTEEGDLVWRVFCARLMHDSCGAISAAPLSAEQVRYCDAAAAQQLQPRAKAKDPRVFTVIRGVSITATRPAGGGGGGSSGPASARSTRGLVCGELCQSRAQLDRMLSRVLSSVLSAAEAASTGNAIPAAIASPAGSGGERDKGGGGGKGEKGSKGGRPASAG